MPLNTNDENEERLDVNPVGSRDYIRYCWLCISFEDVNEEAEWVQPCNCRGISGSVHQLCLLDWVEEKLKDNVTQLGCPHCHTEYIIVEPHMGILVLIMDEVDEFFYIWGPFLATVILASAAYWCAISYGAITVMQVVGQKESLTAMEQAHPWVILIGLPAIPIALYLGKTLEWEDAVLTFMRTYLVRVPLIKYILPFQLEVNINRTITDDDIPPLTPSPTDFVSPTRTVYQVCGALVIPTISYLFGKWFFDSIKPNLHRIILGGLTFIAIKGCLRIYHKQQQYISQRQRIILEYTETNIASYVHQRDS